MKINDNLERRNEMFKETLEVMLTLVVSNPKLTFDVADLIESDFQNLYLGIMKKVTTQSSSKSTMSCCKGI